MKHFLLSRIKNKVSLSTLLLLSIMCQGQDIANLIESVPDSIAESSNAVVLFDDVKVNLKGKEYTAQYNAAILVLNKRAEEFLTFRASYKDGSEKIKNIKISIYDESGNEITRVSKKDLEDIAVGDGYSLITDRRMKLWTYDNEQYPKTIVYSYEKESKNTLSLPSWYPIPGYNIGVVSSSYELVSDQVCISKKLNLEEYPSISSTANGYQMSMQMSLDKEPYCPASMDIFPIMIQRPKTFYFEGRQGSYSSWSEFGDWMRAAFLNELPQVSQSTKQELSSIINEEDDVRTKSKKIYDYVQENTRYVSISLDDGGLKPLSPQKVHEVKYGDCKALSYYMHSLLRLYDIPSNYTVVHAGSQRQIDLITDFPSTYPGNHVILNIPMGSDTLWVDCTSHDNPFDYLGQFTDGRQVLSVCKGQSTLINTPRYSHKDNLVNKSLKLDIDKDGNVTISKVDSLHGIMIDRAIRQLHVENEDIEKRMRNNYDNLKDLTLTEHQVELHEESATAVISQSLTATSYTEQAGNYLFIPMEIAELNVPNLPKDKSRKYPIVIERGMTESMTVTLPQMAQYSLLESYDDMIESPYGTYTISSHKEGDIIKLKKTLVMYEGEYAPDEYNALRNFLNKCRKIERTPLTLSNKT